VAQSLEVERGDVGALRDRTRRVGWNHAAARFRLGQGDLDLGVARDQALVGKHPPHRVGAERVAEQERVEDGGGGGGEGGVLAKRRSIGETRTISPSHVIARLDRAIQYAAAPSDQALPSLGYWITRFRG